MLKDVSKMIFAKFLIVVSKVFKIWILAANIDIFKSTFKIFLFHSAMSKQLLFYSYLL